MEKLLDLVNDFDINDKLVIRLLKNCDKQIALWPCCKSLNKRGLVLTYMPLLIFENELELIVKLAKHKLPQKYHHLVKWEFETLTGELARKCAVPLLKKEDSFWKITSANLSEFKELHPFWKKESMHLLQQYRKLYRGFMNAINDNKVTSKNIISTNAETGITTLQLFDNTLHVYQRSCDMSCGFLADALTINHFKELIGAEHVRWYIVAPHVYDNNAAATREFYENYDCTKRRFKLNVR